MVLIPVLLASNIDVWWFEKAPFAFLGLMSLTILLYLYKKYKDGFYFSISQIDIILGIFCFFAAAKNMLTRIPVIDGQLYMFLAFMICWIVFRAIFNNPMLINYFLKMLFFAILCNAMYGILQYFGLISVSNTYFKATGAFTNPGIWGQYVALGIPIALWRIRYNVHDKRLMYLNIFYLVTIGVALLCSQSWTAILASMGGAFAFYYLFYGQHSDFRLNRKKCVFSALVIFLAIGIALSFINLNAIMGRLLIWKISLDLWLSQPLLGIGLGRFAVQYGYEQAQYFKSGNAYGLAKQVAGMNYYAFNEFLKILVENGIIGLALFVLMIYKAIKQYLKLLTSDKPPVYRIMFIIMLLMLVYAQFSYPFDNIALFVVFLVCLSIAGSQSAFNLKIRLKKAYILCLLAPLLLLATVFSIRKLWAIQLWRQAYLLMPYNEYDAWAKYKEIRPILDNNPSFLFNYGAELVLAKQFDQGISLLKEARKRGNHIELHIFLGDAYLAIGKFKESESEYMMARNMVPSLFMPLDRLLDLYIKTGDVDMLRRTAKPWFGKHPCVFTNLQEH